jgi:hypothetical protein
MYLPLYKKAYYYGNRTTVVGIDLLLWEINWTLTNCFRNRPPSVGKPTAVEKHHQGMSLLL